MKEIKYSKISKGRVLDPDQLKKEYQNIQDRARQMLHDLEILNTLTTEELNTLMFEVLDCFSHRLDAWITALASANLFNIDIDGEHISRNSLLRCDESGASLIGAYGWLERPIKKKPDTLEEYFQAPSVNQAVAGAILRNAALSGGSPDSNRPFQVNLSSSRVKKAVWFMDGLRAGHRAEELLGYKAERSLHDKHLDVHIQALRKKYPLKGQDENQEENKEEKIFSSHVMDGKAFLEDSKTWNKKDIAWAIENVQSIFPPLPHESNYNYVTRVVDPLNSIWSELKQLVDAVSDIYMAEVVYQTVQRNPAKVAAWMEAIEGKNIPPVPEVISTPRTGHMQIQRVIYPFQDDLLSQDLSKLTNPLCIAEPLVANFCSNELTGYEDTVVRVTVASRNLYYFFSWDEILKDRHALDRFIKHLKQDYSIDWIKRENINNNGNTISASDGNSSLSLILNEKKTEVKLKIGDGRTDSFVAKMDNNELKVYSNAKISFVLSPKQDLGIDPIDLVIGDSPELDVKSNKFHVPNLEARAKIHLWKLLLARDERWFNLFELMKSDPVLKPKIESFQASPTAGGLNELTSIEFNYDYLPPGYESSKKLSNVLEKASLLKVFLKSVRPLMPEYMVTKKDKGYEYIIEQKVKGYKYLRERTRTLYKSLLQDQAKLKENQDKLADMRLQYINGFIKNEHQDFVIELQDFVTHLSLYGMKEALTILPEITSEESIEQVLKLLQALATKMDAFVNESPGNIVEGDIVETIIESKGFAPVRIKIDDQDKLVKYDGMIWVEIGETSSKEETPEEKEKKIALKYIAINKLISDSVAYLKNRTAGEAMMIFPPFCRSNEDLAINSSTKTPASDNYKYSDLNYKLKDSFGEYANVRKNIRFLKQMYMDTNSLGVYSDLGTQRSFQEALSMAKSKLSSPPSDVENISPIPVQFFVDKHFIVPKNGMTIKTNLPLAGFLVDEWTDFIPNTQEFTALGLNYETPKSEAPQAILIAVPPAISDENEWKIETVAEIVADTIDLMRLRAVGGEDAINCNLGYLLPCIFLDSDILRAEWRTHIGQQAASQHIDEPDVPVDSQNHHELNPGGPIEILVGTIGNQIKTPPQLNEVIKYVR